MSTVIETDGLSKQFGDLVAVNNLDLAVERGECYAFLGRNGSGKSTTARMLLDFIRPTAGSSTILGGSGGDPVIRSRVGYLPGDLNLPRAMNGNNAFDFFGGLSGVADDPERNDLVERFGLDPTRPFRDLSTGNRRKVGLVLAFMGDPELLILDEPTSGLDPVLQEEFRDLLAERKSRGATIWLTSHVMAEVERVADRVGLIRDGLMACELTMAEVKSQAASRIHLTFPGSVRPSAFDGVPNIADVSAQDGTIVVHMNGPVAAMLARAGELGASEIETERQDLDDVFLQLFDAPGSER
ncbi:MAG: ATP-binding cassette domain-containing protein [Ilumatobacter sp.]|nr:ATP-binding cassette domain-containing protein [Ilumatobacter sp.]